MTGPAHLNSVPKVMMPVYEKIVGLTDVFCDKHLNSEYRDLALARLRGSFVIARNTAFTFKGKPVDAKAIPQTSLNCVRR